MIPLKLDTSGVISDKPFNVILKNMDGINFRIFKIFHLKSKSEPYIKISIPDIQENELEIRETEEIIKPPDSKVFREQNPNFQKIKFHEFSYFYESGVSHFKDNIGQRPFIIKNHPKLSEVRKLNVLRFAVNDLTKFKTYSKSNDNDLILTLPFNDFGRLFNLYLIEDINMRFNNNEPRTTLIGKHVFNIKDTKKYLIILEFAYSRPEFVDKDLALSIYSFKNTFFP